MTNPTAVVIGFIGKLPLAGMALANLHSMAGLEALGYHVHYVERQNAPNECYDPRTYQMTDDPAAALAFLETVLPRYGLTRSDYSFIDREHQCHGSGWVALREALQRADFVVDLGTATWFDELELCPRRAFLDADPMFTQVELLSGQGRKVDSLEHYGTFFTEGLRIGMPDCAIPSAGKRWLPLRTAVATNFWQADATGRECPITTLMNWSSGSEFEYEGRTYGYKNQEFERFMDLPARTHRSLVVAMGGAAPREQLENIGWRIESALAVTETIEAYQKFIAGSAADLGIAKHAYVTSRCGWFSDRSTCYMAAGRPVLHQDTGLGDCLPTGEGVLLFSTLDELLEGLKEIDVDYVRHSRAARAIAEEYFEASKVMKQMIRDAGWS